MKNNLFAKRKLIIATKHHKETVIAPLMERELGIDCYTDPTLDTDLLGTFTGEIEREEDPLTTVRKKCLLAIERNKCELGIASEGSFGPHPSLAFVHADEEWLIFIDKKNNIEIITREISTHTNFNGRTITTEEELLQFADMAHFPSHALILRPDKETYYDIIKGISNRDELLYHFQILKKKYRQVYVETDMRAMHNPMRMQVILSATQKLIAQIHSQCPQCTMPGFWITDVTKGLPCEMCLLPTESVLSHIYSCKHCNYTEEKIYPNGNPYENPMYCGFCNP